MPYNRHHGLSAHARPIDHRRVQRHARWEGDPRQRPQTAAERELQTWRQRRLARFLGVVIGGPALLLYLCAPQTVIATLRGSPTHPAVVRRIGGIAADALTRFYPWAQWAALVVLVVLLIHLIIAACLHAVQRRNRLRAAFKTLTVQVEPSPTFTPAHGAALFVGLQRLNVPHDQWRGREDALVFALVAGEDGRMQLRVRGPTGSRDWTTWLRRQLEGCFPGTTARVADDDLTTALDAAVRARTVDGQLAPRVLGWCDLVLQHPAGYPLNDLSQLDADPLGMLATALQRRPHVHYAAYEIILRAADERWRQSVREQLAHIEARLTPDDLPAHEALLTKAAQPAYDVIVRCIVIADDRATARTHLHDMREALAPFDRPTRGRIQQLQVQPIERLPFVGHPAGRLVAIPPERQPPARAVGQLLGTVALLALVAAVGAAIGVAVSRGALLLVLPRLVDLPARIPLHLSLPTVIPRPPLLASGPAIPFPTLSPHTRALLGGLLGALAAFLAALVLLPSRRQQRTRQAIHAVRSHAHRFVWPGPRWPLPLLGTRCSVLGAVELAALWHTPDAALRQLVATRTVRHLPTPAFALLERDRDDPQRLPTLPPPTDAITLGRRRLAIAQASRPDGGTGFIGPSVRDLRHGMEILGPMGSGKSCFLEVLACELARVGAGFGLIDAKGDLADRLLAALPPEAHDRVVVVDVSGPSVPCINPMDRRLLDAGVPLETLVGQIEQLFARIDPETWPTSLGMQQFCRFGLYAVVEGEPNATLLHLNRFYLSRAYQQAVLRQVRRRNVADFWLHEYPAMDLTLKRSIESFKRRLQKFVTAPLVQHLFCQPRSTLYLPELMDQRAILIVKLVPEVISPDIATVIGTTLLSSLSVAAFTRQQRQPDPEQRWDWPLIVDEIQKFIDVEHVGAAESFFTQTRSLGVGIIGAHQGLWQLGEAVKAAAIQSLGGLAILGSIRQDARVLTDAYAETGITEADLAGLRAREELLIRFPVQGVDTGLLNGIPRERPPAAMPTPARRDQLMAATRTAPFRLARAPVGPSDLTADGMLESLWQMATRNTAEDAADALLEHHASLQTVEPLPSLVEHLRGRSAAHRQQIAAALARDPAQLPDVALRLRELSALRYGVDPAINAVAVRALDAQYPTDLLDGRQHGRRQSTPATTTPPAGAASVASTAPADPSLDATTEVRPWIDLRPTFRRREPS